MNHAVTPLCVMDMWTDKDTYHPAETVYMNLWIKVNTNPVLPDIKGGRLDLEIEQPFGTYVTLSTGENISLSKGTEWEQELPSLTLTGQPFHNMGAYKARIMLISQDEEIYCEASTAFTLKSMFGRKPRSKTLIVTARKTESTESQVSKLAHWLEAAYQTTVSVLYEQGLYQAYQSGLYKNFDVLIYYGVDDKQPPPTELITDIFDGDESSRKKIVWIGKHLDKVQPYLDQYGLKYGSLSTEDKTAKLLYRDSGTYYSLSAPERITVEVTNLNLARVRATVGDSPLIISAKRVQHSEDRECFYFIGFHPTTQITPFGAHLVFLDILNEVYGIEREKIALVRLEDIHARVKPQDLFSVTDFLQNEGIPFTLALIPVYVEDGVEIRISENKEFRIMVKNTLLAGGELVIHGDTHQYEGQTAVDYEFWDEKIGTPIGNTEYARKRVGDALIEVAFSDLLPFVVGWETPHYAASGDAYTVFEKHFELIYEGPRWGLGLQNIPYPIQTENNLYVPTNLGYVRVDSQKKDVEQMLQEAQLLAGLQHGAIASFFYHPWLGVENLKKLVQGLKKQGWGFKLVSSFIQSKDTETED